MSQSMILSHDCTQMPVILCITREINCCVTRAIDCANSSPVTLYQPIIYNICRIVIFPDQWLNQSVHQGSFHIVRREFFACHSRNRSIWEIDHSVCQSIFYNLSHSLLPSMTQSASQSIDDPFTLFHANSLPAIPNIDQSRKSITLSFTKRSI